jgi:acyl-CoA reductase-like NAD-dependent aldehyde dehydrogenase
MLKPILILDTRRRSLRESEFEVSYSLDVIEQHCESLNFEESIQKESEIAKGRQTTDWREPLGTVAIVCEAKSLSP